MKATIFDNVLELNKFLATKKKRNFTIDFRSFVVGELMDNNGMKKYQMVDRILVIED